MTTASMVRTRARHLVSIRDLTDDDLYTIVARGARYATGELGSPWRAGWSAPTS
ncbi:hypothetical protein Phou_067550 [Phytohabitans houttuyneae]|uniref:Uncharacterized protein n=1 Tax=Phytohabitans houttuyneae TaxID=1076126 RepID=A0A6V8KPH2_9ACTN|nr:hypothetical protein Phou_067550 [Phytohabitans houttuyneae]